MKAFNKMEAASTKFLASTAGVAVMFMILAAVVASWKPREKFTDCSMTATCAL